jgi:signal transduction histidine kinase
MLPTAVKADLTAHLQAVRLQYQTDLRHGAGWVELPWALARKYPNAGHEWAWQWVFPATRTYVDRVTGQRHRHHLHESVLQRGVNQAVRRAGITISALSLGECLPVVRVTLVGRSVLERRTVHVADIQAEAEEFPQSQKVAQRLGHRTVLNVPLIHEGVAIGVIGIRRTEAQLFTDRQIALLRTFADQAVIAIENVRLFKELAARNREIEDKSRQIEAASHHKSEFLANMSHELRTPLNAIIGFSEVLTARMFGELNEKQDEYLKDIYASGQHLLSLINDILDLSKVEAGRMELERTDFDLPTAIDNALTLVRERAGRRGITLGWKLDDRLGMIRGDERKVKQVLLNLLSNALKFTPEGGRIDLHAALNEGLVEVSVADTGVGIAPEDQEAVFEEFRQVGTADKNVDGTGLGLALSRKFVELHGGRIWVKSQVGVGSTFTFTLPLHRET